MFSSFVKKFNNANVLTFSFCCLIYGNYYRLTKTHKVSRASQTNRGPAKPEFGWPDWPAKEKVKLDPWVIEIEANVRKEKWKFVLKYS